ncbi:MAG: PAS domain S-box protein [wastewater metagenome]|nr:PAS domain S-box protein [Candidatus Loosdrechtia aerotolerans]
MGKLLHVLIVEDSVDDADLLLLELKRGGYDPVYERVETALEMKETLERQEWDVVISDHSLPRFNSIDALKQLQQTGLDIPFIIVSAIIGEEIAVAAMKAGAHDYVMKSKLARLVPAIERELKEAEERRKHKQAEEALRKSQARLANAQRIAHIGNWEWDIVNNASRWSDEAYRIFGLTPQSYPITSEKFLSFVHPDDRNLIQRFIHETLYEGKRYNFDHRILLPDGSERIVHEEAEVIFDGTGKPVLMNGVVQDITERKRAEEATLLLQTTTKAIAETGDFHSALTTVLQKVCEATSWVYGEVWIPFLNNKHIKLEVAWYDNEYKKLEEFKKRSQDFILQPGTCLPGRIWYFKKPEWIPDVTVDKNFPRSSLAKEYGLKTAMGIPVIADNNVIAILVFFEHECRREDKQLIKLVSSIATQLGSLIQRKQMEEQLRKLSLAIEQNPGIVIITDAHANIEYVNPKFTELTGYTLEEVRGKNPRILKSEKTPPEVYGQLWNAAILTGEWHGELINRKKNGELYWEFAHISPVKDSQGTITHFMKIAEDITRIKQVEEEKEKLREQLYHAQRLESIGRFSGAIAHDFNNILSAIIGCGEQLRRKAEKKGPLMEFIQRILSAAEKGVNLTDGLLTFSRKHTVKPKPVNLNETIKRSTDLLHRLIHKDITFNVVLSDKDCTVIANNNQIEQVLMNLATNARDAMPNGGVLTIRTNTVDFDTKTARACGLDKGGTYVLMSVSDTGMGMSKETKQRLFEPFFTTKEVGKGTGLGLAIIYGIIKQHKGCITVDSEPGKGTTFNIYLPAGRLTNEGNGQTESQSPTATGSKGTILMAEDEEDFRRNLKTVFEEHGYTIIDAVDGEDAVDKFMKNKDTVTLLLLDLMMPKKNGKDVYDEIKKEKPDIKAFFMSGYSRNIIHTKLPVENRLDFISKNLSLADILKKVSELLNT